MGSSPEFSPEQRSIHSRPPAPEFPDEEVAAFTEHLRRRLSPGARVLDAGCGRGRNALYLAEFGFQVSCIDLSSVAVTITRTRMEQWNLSGGYQVGSLLELPFSSGCFDAAICVRVLPYHLKADLLRGLQELRRVLRPGGYLYFDLFDREDSAYGGGLPVEADTFLNLHGAPIHFSSRAEIDELTACLCVERILHLEIHSVLGARRTWGIWAAKDPAPA